MPGRDAVMTAVVGHGAGMKGEPQALLQPAQRPWLLTSCERWQSEEVSASSASSGDASSLFLPMQDEWDDAFAQPQPDCDVKLGQSVTTSAAWLPAPAIGSMASPFAASYGSIGAIDCHPLPVPGAVEVDGCLSFYCVN